MLGEGIYRCAGGGQSRRRVGVHRDEHVGVVAPSHFRPLAQRNEHVAVAHQARLEAFLAVDPPRQQAGDGQRHVLFALALATDRAGVLAAMAGIDHHEDVAARRG